MVSIIEKGFLDAPFGIQSIRFNDLRVHPRMRLPIQNNLGPGSYEAVRNFDKEKLKTFTSPWTKALIDEEFSKLPQVLRKHWYLYMKDEPNRRGPGKYFREESSCKLKSFSKYGPYATFSKRFTESKNVKIPGPGTYGSRSNPYETLENAELKRKMKIKGVMCSETVIERGDKVSKHHKGPGLYNIKSYTDELLNKVISVRGPYDLFTGKRDESSLYGYQIAPMKCTLNLSPGVYHYKYFLDEWENIYIQNHGHFFKTPRFKDKTEITPGPGHYNPKFPKHKDDIIRGDVKIPFLFTAVRPTIFERTQTRSGPGSYEIKRDPVEKNGCVSSFKSSRKLISSNHGLINKHKTIAPCYRYLLKEEYKFCEKEFQTDLTE